MTEPIDREAVVRRHAIRRTAPDALEPLTVGNGELAYTADVTGMQTLTRLHDAVTGRRAGRPVMPLSTQSQWGFHEMPNPEGWDLDDVTRPWPSPRGDVPYATEYDFRHEPPELRDDERAGWFLWTNPQRLDLARLGFVFAGTAADADPDVTDVEQTLDPWTGVLESRFRVAGELVEVTTACDPERDVLAFRIRSALLADGRARVELAFPYASETFADTTDWDHPEAHTTTAVALGGGITRFDRVLDAAGYAVRVATTGSGPAEASPHHYLLGADGTTLDLVVAFDRTATDDGLPAAGDVVAASRAGWARFWRSGAAIDLGAAEDPRAAELERRIVLSQYVTRVHCAGSMPSAETGLTQNSWAGKFNLEMHWWHAAHFAMWGRPELLERSFAWYLDDLPVAQGIARRQGFRGARWPKHVGPEGRESPNDIGPLLLWQQPHPIHFAELLRLARPESQDDVLARWSEIVDETAAFLVSFLWRDPADGVVHLPPSLMPAQERYDPREVWDPTFELAYVAWALGIAQQWRELRGLDRDAETDALLADLTPLPTEDGRYAAIGNPSRTIPSDHPSMVAALGVTPASGMVDPAVMAATVRWVVDEWQWESAWGWDFPMLAMTATRLHDPATAVDVLLMDQHRNRYLANGHNCQDPLRLPLYVPGNGGVLAATALMAAGWAGDDTPHPGFPDHWNIRAEGFAPRP